MDWSDLVSTVHAAAAKHVPISGTGTSDGLKDEYRRRLAEWRAREPDMELQCTVPAGTPQSVFTGLCVLYGLVPYRRPRQRKTTICVRAPRSFLYGLFWPQFEALAFAVEEHLCEVVRRAMEEWSGQSFEDRFGPVPGNEDEPMEVG